MNTEQMKENLENNYALYYLEDDEVNSFIQLNKDKNLIAYGTGAFYEDVAEKLLALNISFSDVVSTKNNEIISSKSDTVFITN